MTCSFFLTTFVKDYIYRISSILVIPSVRKETANIVVADLNNVDTYGTA